VNIFSHIDEMGSTPDAVDIRNMVADLQSAPEVEPSAGLAGRIMAAVALEGKVTPPPHSRELSFKPWFGAAAAAAAVLALLAVRYISAPQNDGGDRAVADEQWLADCQEADGSWNPARHNGARAYQPALTALSTLALHRSGAGYKAEVTRARDWLMKIQRPDGTFGGSGRESLYNQAIVTLVLAETCDRDGSSDVLKKAVDVIKRTQSVVGGWDYVDGSEGSAAITSWQIEALAAAHKAGVSEAGVSMRKGLRWLRDLSGVEGHVSYNKNSARGSETISALAGHALITAGSGFPELSDLGRRVVASMDALPQEVSGGNLYRDCMKVRALTAAGEQQNASDLKGRLAAAESDAGRDQWGKIGGRLYMASMQSLARTF
jgi:prenyltransferase beta subunit